MTKYDIYVAYNRTDLAFTQKCVQHLEEQGYSCFADYKDMPNGSSYAEQLFEAINSSKSILLIYSKGIEKSQYVRRELEFAIDLHIPLISITLSEIDPNSWYYNRFDVTLRLYEIILPSGEFQQSLLNAVNKVVGHHQKDDRYDSSALPSPCYKDYKTYGGKSKKRKWIYIVIISIIVLVSLSVYGTYVKLENLELEKFHKELFEEQRMLDSLEKQLIDSLYGSEANWQHYNDSIALERKKR